MNNLHICLNEFRNASRMLKEADSLTQSGLVDQVFIAALHASDVAENQDYGDRIHVKRFALTTRGWGKNSIAQGIKYIEFCFRVLLHYRKLNIKMVNVHSVALLPLGLALKIFYSARLIYDAHELETEVNGSHGIRKALSKFLEGRLIRYVDMTIVVGENIADWYANEYGMPRPVVVMNAPRFQIPQASNIFRDKFGIRQDQVIFIYQGGIAKGRGVPLLLDAFNARTNDKAVIVFMGYGEMRDAIKAAAQDNPIVFYHQAVPTDQVLKHTAAADVGIHMIHNTCLNHFYCMPNKLFEYAMAGLAVIVSPMKEMADFVRRYNCGYVLEAMTPAELNNLIDEILTQDLTVLKQNAMLAAQGHSWEHQEQKMLSAYRNMYHTEGK